MFVCTFFPQQNFSYLHINSHQQQTSSKMNNGKRVVTLATTNIMLANEFFCRLKNNRHPLLRSKFIGNFVDALVYLLLHLRTYLAQAFYCFPPSGKQLLKQSSTYLNNFSPSMRRDECVIEDLPDVDILCIQEVWERYWASSMIGHLRAKYNYFIHGKISLKCDSVMTFLSFFFFFIVLDVGEFSLCTNYCLFGRFRLPVFLHKRLVILFWKWMTGSGLFVACKYPVEAADFKSFRFKKRNAKFFSYGVLCMKVFPNLTSIYSVCHLTLSNRYELMASGSPMSRTYTARPTRARKRFIITSSVKYSVQSTPFALKTCYWMMI